MEAILEKCKAIYKGDILAGSFYMFIGIVFFISAIGLWHFTTSEGFMYLSISFLSFAVLSFGKGFFKSYIYYSRYKFYQSRDELDPALLREELSYTKFRAEKKANNRRAYIYATVITSLIAFLAVFTSFKAILTGTLIPIALYSGLEFCISLLSEFRLWEYIRSLEKNQ